MKFESSWVMFGSMWVSGAKSGDEEEEVIDYEYQEHDREFPRSAELSIDRIIHAATEFFQTAGERPNSVEWQEFI
ncbi:Imm1 family immunity protein [Actinokineospora sp. G85]|uniref:Imm1 family immunity protein n=1 Tax=Actinokineospora sp. G85 TaxID=3406626 RepID=UPI003C780882